MHAGVAVYTNGPSCHAAPDPLDALQVTVELEPNAVVPEHRHANEQLGMVIRGRMHFTVDGETRDLGPGGTWRILGDRPHDVVAGPEGAVVIDVFTPVRSDWDEKPIVGTPAPRWPEA